MFKSRITSRMRDDMLVDGSTGATRRGHTAGRVANVDILLLSVLLLFESLIVDDLRDTLAAAVVALDSLSSLIGSVVVDVEWAEVAVETLLCCRSNVESALIFMVALFCCCTLSLTNTAAGSA